MTVTGQISTINPPQTRIPQLLEHLPLPVYACDAGGGIIFYNEKAIQLWGRLPEPSQTDPEFWTPFRLYSETGSPISYQQSPMALAFQQRDYLRNGSFSFQRDRGPLVHLSVDISPIFEEGQFAGTVTILANRTESVETDRAVRSSEERYRTLLQSIDTGFCLLQMIFDDQDRPIDYLYLEANPAFEQQTGIINPVGRTIRELVPGIEQFWVETYGRVALTGKSIHFTDRAEALDRWFDVFAFRFGDPAERKVALLFTDITVRHRTEERLAYQLRLTETIATRAAEALFLMDAQGRVTFMNPAAEEMFGWSSTELVGEILHEFVHHHREDGTPFPLSECPLARVMTSGESVQAYEDLFFKRDGTRVWVRCSNAPVFANGSISGAVLVVSDITQRRAVEQQLRSSEARYRELFTSITEGFCVLEKVSSEPGEPIDFCYVEVNPAFAEQSGLPDVLGRTVRQVIPAEADHWIGVYDHVLQSGDSIRLEREVASLSRMLELYAYRIGGGTKAQVGILFRDVTDRKSVEEELRKQLRLTETITSGAGEALFLLDSEGRVSFLNPAAEAMFGWSRSEMTGLILHDVIHHKHADGTSFPVSSCRLISLMKSGRGVRGHDDTFFRRDGTPVLVRCSNEPVVEDGKIIGAVLVVADVTENKRQEEQLRRNHDTFYQLIQRNPFGIYVVDADFRLRQVSLGAQKVFSNVRPLLGRDFAEVLRTIWEEPFASQAVALFRHTLESGEPYSAPSTVERRQDIQVVEAYDWRIERVTLPDGRFGVVCYFYDLSERQQWEAALRVSEERFQLAARATNDAIWDWDLATDSLWWNEGIQTLFGYGSDQVINNANWWSEKVHPEDRDRIVGTLDQVLKHGQTYWRAEYRFRRDNGDYAHVFDCGYVMRDSAGAAVRMLGAMQDLTERKNAETALAQARQQLEQHAVNLEQTVAERTAKLRETVTELETLSYSISHDMRAPLRAMQGFSQALLEDYRTKLDQDGIAHLERISAAAQRLDLLIQDILLYTSVGRERLVLTPVALEPLIRETVKTYHPDQEQNVSILSPFPPVLGHQAFLSQILSNLLTNALKFVPRGQPPAVIIRSETIGDVVKIWVEDKGIGIAPHHLTRIFQVFGRVYGEKEYPGTGIGLAIVKRAVQKLGGDVGVESTLGQGSRFWFTLRKAD